MENSNTISLHIQDMSGQREFVAKNIPRDAYWGETMGKILSNMQLPQNTPSSGNTWTGRLEREGRHLHTSEIIGDAMINEDHIVLQPEVNAG